MKRIILTFIFMMSYGITTQVLAKEKGKIQEDELPTLSYLAEDVTFLDEMKRELLLTPEQIGKIGTIIKAEKDTIETLQQKWMQILKDKKFSAEQKREERDKMDKEIIQIAKKTKTDVEEILTTFQYNKFIRWIKETEQAKSSPAPPPKRVNPFEKDLQKNKEIEDALFSSSSNPTEAQQKAQDEFIKALESQSQAAQNLFSDSLQSDTEEEKNPFAELPDEASENLEDLFTSQEEDESEFLTNPFEEALPKSDVKKE